MFENYEIIDISQPITKNTACFPGDTPFSYLLEASYLNTGGYNATAFKMSPHIGTHTDAPAHVMKTMETANLAGSLPLDPFIGPCLVIDLSPCNREISLKDIEGKLNAISIPPRVLLRTRRLSHFDIFDEESAYLSLELVGFLNRLGVKLVGIDTPSVDHIHSKTLDVHHALISHHMVWLENLDLSAAKENMYFLSALPLKLMDLEAAPVRAVLLAFKSQQRESESC